jgi:hypothetical protein
MSTVLPPNALEKVQFCENHTAPWTTNATAIGTTTTAVTDLTTKTTAARAAFNAQQSAQQVAMAATSAYLAAVKTMASAASDIIKSVKVKAATAGSSVYDLAQIPAPALPSPKAAPGQPTDFTVTLDATGVLNLGWKCPNPVGTSGTIYQVWRRASPTADFTYVGGTGTKSFIDATLPAGSAAVTYQIQAVRSTAVGPWAQFNVNFGISGGGTMTASIAEPLPAKLAA